MNHVVQTKLLTKQFRTVTALQSCSLSIEEGEVFGLLGPNGAGKSTLLRLLMGFLNPTSGSATICGLNCQTQRQEVHRQVTYLPGDARLFRMMRGRNALKLFCGFRENSSFEMAVAIADRLELDLSRWVGLMSTGMRQKLALAIALANEAPLIILDEPTANLDPTVRGRLMEMICEAKSAGKTVIFSSHVLPEIEDTCDRVGILRAGELVHVEALSELKKQHRIEAHLNGEMPAVPDALIGRIQLKQTGDKIQVETASELSEVLKWLANAPLADVYIQPVGLRSVYDQFHHPTSVATRTEATA